VIHTKKITPWLYIAPATFLLFFFLVYPSINTVYISFFNYNSEIFVGIKNYLYCFTNEIMLNSFRNNALWVIIFVPLTVSLGLIIAVLAEPMAISCVGAGIIWKFVYAYRPASAAQVGILNAIRTFFRLEPLPWLIEKPWLNNFCLIMLLNYGRSMDIDWVLYGNIISEL
jgi:alpha-glucoside transport system permease protein